MRRRKFLQHGAAGLGTALATPHVALGQAARPLKFIPSQDLALLDPIQSPAGATLQHSAMVFDTLYGLDTNFKAQPQMVEGHVVENDGKTWRLTLREGLRFHNGEPVRATDVVASLARWGAKDSFGLTLMANVDAMQAASDRVVEIRLKKPFPLIPDALGKIGAHFAIIVPEHLAKTPPNQGMPEIIGSGPYRYVPSERVAGSLNVYSKFAGYVPRPSGSPSLLAGPKVAHFERVEWHTLPDAATASAALQTGEMDWWDQPTTDYIPSLRRTSNVQVQVRNVIGSMGMLRPNQVQPPFNNPAIRRAVMQAINQTDFMIAVAGNDPAMWRANCGFFTPGSPMASDAGMEALNGPRDLSAAKRALEAAGYRGEKTVLLAPTDIPVMNAMSEVGGDMLRKLGMNVDYQALDWGTVLQRLNSREPPEKGGWSLYPNYVFSVSMLGPAANNYIRGSGNSAMFGWPTSPKLEDLRNAWLDAPDEAAQQRICREMQLQAFQDVPYYPLGIFYSATAFRSDLAGVLEGYSLFYNVRRT
jgi:peptide/nickel transport system substrate-binding protein